jgi:hypothetical protein
MNCALSQEHDRAARYVGGELSEDERDAFEVHFLECPECLALMQTLSELPAVLRAPQRLAAVPVRRWRPIAFASLAAAAALAVWLVPWHPAGDQALRGGAHAVVELLPTTTDAAGLTSFAWTPLAGAGRYRISLFSEDGRTVWTREVDAPPVRWPDDVPRAAGAYRWRVEALASGAIVGRSRLAVLEITP